ncbi:hypothetical protein BSK60_15145 [Paenibacillus odorifer]|nr:hypothetical protein BSK60_15145 [Paenibacillus odorifer]
MWSERGNAEHMRQRACEMWSEHGNAEHMRQRANEIWSERGNAEHRGKERTRCGVSVEMLNILSKERTK